MAMEETKKILPEMRKALLKVIDKATSVTNCTDAVNDSTEALEQRASATRHYAEAIAMLSNSIVHAETEVSREAKGDRW